MSLVVIGLIVAYHAPVAAGALYLSIALGLLLGGALGNLIDRLRLGYVVDFVDIGIGDFRLYTFNVADAAISLGRSCSAHRDRRSLAGRRRRPGSTGSADVAVGRATIGPDA